MRNLESYGTQELSMKETNETEGGLLLHLAFMAGLALAYYEVRIKE